MHRFHHKTPETLKPKNEIIIMSYPSIHSKVSEIVTLGYKLDSADPLQTPVVIIQNNTKIRANCMKSYCNGCI